jgi:mono/diheme cytochrome c family protein
MEREQEQAKPAVFWAVAAGVAGTLLVMALLGLTIVYTGAYDPAATRDHTPLERWALSTSMRQAVQARAEDLPDLGAADLERGAIAYKEMCEHCHGAPGARRAAWAEGMLPQPPDLTHAANEWNAGEIAWIVRHGVRMTAMPAFGPTHDDAAIRDIAAFVEQLPTLTPARYASLSESGKTGQDHGGEH